jgi:hypothetical protein
MVKAMHAPPAGKSDLVERSALGISLVCLAHCLAMPLLFAALPALASLVPAEFSFHLLLLGLALPSSGFALLTGYLKHRRVASLLTGCLGLVLLAVGVLVYGGSRIETPVTVTGALLLAAAHVINMRLRSGPRAA